MALDNGCSGDLQTVQGAIALALGDRWSVRARRKKARLRRAFVASYTVTPRMTEIYMPWSTFVKAFI